MGSETTGNEIELKNNRDSPFPCSQPLNSGDLENTHYCLELESEIDLGLREDTNYVLVKTDDNEFKFCEIKAEGNSVDLQLQSPKSKIAIRDSMATRLPTEECHQTVHNKQESGVLSQVESGTRNLPLIPSLPEAPVSDSREIIHAVQQIEHPLESPTALASYSELSSRSQPSFYSDNSTSETYSTSQMYKNVPHGMEPKPLYESVEQISHLYTDLKLKYCPSRRRGRPRKYNLQQLPPMHRKLSPNITVSTEFNMECKESLRNASAPLISPGNIQNRNLNGRSGIVENFDPLLKIKSGSQMMDYREYQKMQDKNRRSRIKAACQTFRTIVPGITRRTDSTSVWEQSVQYLAFLKQSIGTNYDMEFLGY